MNRRLRKFTRLCLVLGIIGFAVHHLSFLVSFRYSFPGHTAQFGQIRMHDAVLAFVLVSYQPESGPVTNRFHQAIPRQNYMLLHGQDRCACCERSIFSIWADYWTKKAQRVFAASPQPNIERIELDTFKSNTTIAGIPALGTYRRMSIPTVDFLIPLPLAFGLMFIRGAWHRRFGTECVKCDYDLKGNQSGVCPECGTVCSK